MAQPGSSWPGHPHPRRNLVVLNPGILDRVENTQVKNYLVEKVQVWSAWVENYDIEIARSENALIENTQLKTIRLRKRLSGTVNSS